jgi:ribosomal-protein-alanine acetyltransferase
VRIRITKASLRDLPAMIELEQTCFTAYRLTARQLRYLLRRQTAVVLVAKANGAVIGDAIGLLRRSTRVSGRIYTIAVNPTYRGKNIGAKLLDALLRRLRRRGAQRLTLEVQKRNRAAIALYENNGFQITKVLKDYYAKNRDGLRMTRLEKLRQ